MSNLIVGNLKINNVTQRKIGILGGTGSGKTSTLKLLALASTDRVFVFDPLNVINIKGFDKVIFRKTSIGKGKSAGEFFNKKTKKNVIFSFDGLLQSELADFVNDFFSVWSPKDCIIAIDEVHEFVPESGTSAKYAPEVERAIKHWRNQNVGFIFTSQRPAYVKKNVLALTDYLIVLRTTYPTDTKVIEEIASNILNEDEMKIVMGGIKSKPFLNGYSIDFRYQES